LFWNFRCGFEASHGCAVDGESAPLPQDVIDEHTSSVPTDGVVGSS
jgi:hypothetical protein